MNFKQNLYYFFFSKPLEILFIAALKLNLPSLCSFLIFLSLFKLKNISNPKSYKNTKIIIYKSVGISDVESALKNREINNRYFVLNRNYLLITMNFFLKKKIYDLELFDNPITKSKKFYNYEIFMERILKTLRLLIGNYSFFSFNFLYHDEYVLHKICYKNKIKFSIINKESISSPNQIITKKIILKKLIRKPIRYINKILVYNKTTYKLLREAEIFHQNQIVLGGCARVNIGLKKNDQNINSVIYFFTDNSAGKINHFKSFIYKYRNSNLKKMLRISEKLNLNSINFEILKIFQKLAKKYKKIKFLVKVKSGGSQKDAKEIEKLYACKNLKFLYGGAGHNYILNAKVVLGLNTTAIIESLCLNKPTFVPLQKKFLNKIYNGFFHQYPKQMKIIGSKKIYSTLKNILKEQKQNFLKERDKNKLINFYLGDIKNSNKILFNFLEHN